MREKLALLQLQQFSHLHPHYEATAFSSPALRFSLLSPSSPHPNYRAPPPLPQSTPTEPPLHLRVPLGCLWWGFSGNGAASEREATSRFCATTSICGGAEHQFRCPRGRIRSSLGRIYCVLRDSGCGCGSPWRVVVGASSGRGRHGGSTVLQSPQQGRLRASVGSCTAHGISDHRVQVRCVRRLW
jgi:hypothetical protein